jgi:ABC-type transport system involved in cytochrome c biogenesis permease subunit
MASLDNLIFLLLLFVTILYWSSLIFTNFKILNKLSFFGNVLVNGLIFTLLGLRWLNYGYFPLSNLYESLIFLSWGISTIQLFLEDKTKSRLIGAIGTPLIFFLAGFSSLTLPTEMQKSLPLVPSLQSNWLMMHVSMMMVSYATLIIGSLFSLLYFDLFFLCSQIWIYTYLLSWENIA